MDEKKSSTTDKNSQETGSQEVVPLTLRHPSSAKKSSGTQVVQSFSHGRSKAVTVEVKRKRLIQRSTSDRGTRTGEKLTAEEQGTRIQAVKEALQVAAKEALVAEQEQKERQQSEAAAIQNAPVEDPFELGIPSTEVDSSHTTRKKGEGSGATTTRPSIRALAQEDSGKDSRKRPFNKEEPRRSSSPHKDTSARTNLKKLYGNGAPTDDSAFERRRGYGGARKKKSKNLPVPQAVKLFRDVTIPPSITVQELAIRMSEKGSDVIRTLLKMDVVATLTQAIDADTAELVVSEMGHTPHRVSEESVIHDLLRREDDSPDTLVSRAPVVTVMGHVDHGKTSLLDALRKTNVVHGEKGGITQHIGAYQVILPQGKITFIDTPGHAAFTEMRARGTHVTDIVVLVVAADDGVKEQTVEAIRHAHAAEVPLIVAINKMDKHDANPDVVRNMLLQHNVVVESLGGDILDVPISAQTGLNLDKLEEAILLQAELLDLQSNPQGRPEGTVIEARIEKGRGAVATVLVQYGTLKIGDIFVSGATWGRVRSLLNSEGLKVSCAILSEPVEVSGFESPPKAGDSFVVLNDESQARQIAEMREHKQRELKTILQKPLVTLENFQAVRASEGLLQELPIILKVDVQGSLEAIQGSLEKMETEEVKVRVLYSGVGGVTESDVHLAQASNALILGFNVRANAHAREIAHRQGVEIRYYSIIYNLIDEVKASLSGLLSPVLKEKLLGNAEVRRIFNITKAGRIAGCYVTTGIVRRGARIRLLRDNIVIYEGALKTLKRLKEEVREVREGYECGMAFENYQDLREGDGLECFEIESIQRTL